MINPANEASIDPIIVADSRVMLQKNPLLQLMWG